MKEWSSSRAGFEAAPPCRWQHGARSSVHALFRGADSIRVTWRQSILAS